MPELAQVVVDVPTMQTNQPYTYQIPPKLEKQIQVGVRVIVPFGKGKRTVQGFVVALDNASQYEGELKPIQAIMDLQPVINPELMNLSKWLADTTYSFWISCLYTMLPNLLKAKTTRIIRIIDEVDEHVAFDIFHGRDELEMAAVQDKPAILRLVFALYLTLNNWKMSAHPFMPMRMLKTAFFHIYNQLAVKLLSKRMLNIKLV